MQKGRLVALLAAAFLVYQPPPSLARQFFVTSPRGFGFASHSFAQRPFAQRPFGQRGFGWFGGAFDNGFCCWEGDQPPTQAMVLGMPQMALPPPPPQVPAYAPPTVEKTPQGVTIVRGPPIPPWN
jgi:hypothetical protein